MIIKLVSITLVFIVLTSEVSTSPARSRAVVASKTANKLSPDRSERNIQPLPCQDKDGARGVCMFAWNCAEAGGQHLGTCVDRFYFGSCCKLPDVINSIEESTDKNEDVAPAAIPATTESTTVTTGSTAGSSASIGSTGAINSGTSPGSTGASSESSSESSTGAATGSEIEIGLAPVNINPTVDNNKPIAESPFAPAVPAKPVPSTIDSTTAAASITTTTAKTTTTTSPTTAKPPSSVVVTASIPIVSEDSTTQKEEITTEATTITTTTTSTTTSTTTTTSRPTTTTTTTTTTTIKSSDNSTSGPNTIFFPVDQDLNSSDLWGGMKSIKDMERLLRNASYEDACGRRPWKKVKSYNKIYPEGHYPQTKGFSESRINQARSRTRNSKFLWDRQRSSSNRNREGRIVQGGVADYGEWPWQVSLRQWRTSTYIHKCGCALLSENWAITAAHCVEDVPPDDLMLRMGEYNMGSTDEPQGHIDRKVQIVASHPKFDPKTFEYDLALLRFYEPIEFQPNVVPICIPDDDQKLVGETAWVTGWGRLYEDGPLPGILHEVSLPIINNNECEGMYQDAGYIEHIPYIFICAGFKEGGKDSCEGDSGGPMVVQREDGRFQLSGIISWGIGCAEENQPGVYTRISEFKDWINQILQF